MHTLLKKNGRIDVLPSTENMKCRKNKCHPAHLSCGYHMFAAIDNDENGRFVTNTNLKI